MRSTSSICFFFAFSCSSFSKMKRSLVIILLGIEQILGLCWKPNSTPFYGQPRVVRNGDRARVEWEDVFNDGPDCQEVDFLIMMHPKDQPSAYQLSDFTLKGERKATLKIDPQTDYVFQVIAREDKGSLGIDYKYSDMVITSSGTSRPTPTTTKRPQTTTYSYIKPQTKSLTSSFANPEPLQYDEYEDIEAKNEGQNGLDEVDFDATPWYIYECVPFIKELQGYDESSGSQNKLLESFIKRMNTKPLEMVNEFLTKDKKEAELCQVQAEPEKSNKGFLKTCESTQMCCNNPWTTKKCQKDCFSEFQTCDGNRCIPQKWVQDGWPDCLDGSDENPGGDRSLPEQLVCIQCAGVVLSAGFVCREARMGLTNQCIQDIMGANGACNNCVSYYFNLP